jgi:Tol biopolymer transport system component
LPHYGTDVWLFSIREGEQPVAITRDENSEFWYYQLSPDGRYIAYQGEIKRGSSLWLIDLGDALASSSQ